MRALMFGEGLSGPATVFEARLIHAADLGAETWLQRLVFEHPELLPIDEIDPGARAIAPLCRELTLPRPQGPVYLDMLGVTRRGRLVLVECKLWRNPQARREVIGQILEYAALLQKLSYGDLSAQVSARTGVRGPNPIWSIAAERLGVVDEAAFVDAVSGSLSRGEFDLLLVGDGIRSEIGAVRSYLEAAMGPRTRLALVEMKSFWSAGGQVVLAPQLAMRTQVVEHRWLEGASLPVEPIAPAMVRTSGPPAENEDRAFWQRFLEAAVFDHPDQPPPSSGGRNWVRMPLPSPFSHATAFRSVKGARYGRLGVFMTLKGEAGQAVFEGLNQDRKAVQAAFAEPVILTWDDDRDSGLFEVDRLMGEPLDETAQLTWLLQAANTFTSVIRPRLVLSTAG
jgi:hypothetical protein